MNAAHRQSTKNQQLTQLLAVCKLNKHLQYLNSDLTANCFGKYIESLLHRVIITYLHFSF